MSVGNQESAAEKQPFPLNVVKLADGWGIVVYLENGQSWNLLKPGWQEEKHAPYRFGSAEQAWHFLRRMFLFCLKQQHVQHLNTDKILNCEQCGRVFRARFYQYCTECLQENEFLLQQIWQGFYYMTGSQEDAFHKMSLLLKLPNDRFGDIQDGFRNIVRHNLDTQVHRDQPKLDLSKPLKSAQAPGMHSVRHHRRG